MSGNGDAHLDEVADGVHAWIQPDGGWCLNNAGIVRGDDGLIVIDTAATQRRALALHAAATSVAPLPVRTVVTTHHHGDHVFGNAVFPGATVVAHRDARTEMIRSGTAMQALWPDVEWGSLPPVPPHLTFDDRLTLHAGATTVELRHVGPAHTVGDVVVWLPEQRVLFAGDVLMSGATPFVLMGSAAGLREAVATLRGLEPRVIVCGHGPVCGPEVLDDTDAYLDLLLDLAATGVEQGLEPLQVARRAELGRFAGFGEPERLVANLHRAMAELSGTGHGAHIPSAAGFRDMIALGGNGAGLPCSA
jgi:cyclase